MKPDDQLKKGYTLTINPEGILEAVFLIPTYDDLESDRINELLSEDFLALVAKHPGKKFKVLFDLQRIEQNANLTPKIREVYEKLAGHPQLEKVAVVGNAGLQMLIINFVLSLVQDFLNIKWFPSRDEAMLWLRQ